jgi:hypothetical protein
MRTSLYLALVCLLVTSCEFPEQKAVIELPAFTVVDEAILDIPLKAQVEQHLLISGDFTEEGVRTVLQKQFDEAMQRGGWQHHGRTTNVFIYAYETEDRAKAQSGLWFAMLSLSPSNGGQPVVTIKDVREVVQANQPEEILGLSEEARKAIFFELVRSEDRALVDAEKAEPSDLMKHLALERSLQEKYKDELASKHSLTREQLSQIGVEGVRKRWPAPSL